MLVTIHRLLRTTFKCVMIVRLRLYRRRSPQVKRSCLISPSAPQDLIFSSHPLNFDFMRPDYIAASCASLSPC